MNKVYTIKLLVMQKENLAAVGFEPTPPKRLVPKTSALDHSATLPDALSLVQRIANLGALIIEWSRNVSFQNSFLGVASIFGERGITMSFTCLWKQSQYFVNYKVVIPIGHLH